MEERLIERRFAAIDKRQTEQEELLTRIFTEVGRGNTDIGVLKHEMAGARADITAIKATQSDHGELLRELKQDIDIVAKDLASFRVKNEQIMLEILRRLPTPEG